MATTIHKFLFRQCKVILVEQTRDTEELGKYLLKVRDKGVTATKIKLGKIFQQIQNQNQLVPV